jgi:hypothetical protein
MPNQFPVQHLHGPTNILSPFEILSVGGVVLVLFVIVMQCYVCPADSRRRPNDEAEAQLLAAYHTSEYPAAFPHAYGFGYAPQVPPGYSMSFQVPNQGVLFPAVPDSQNTGDL